MDVSISRCPVCHNDLRSDRVHHDPIKSSYHINCQYCGEYVIEGWKMRNCFFPRNANAVREKDMDLCISLRHLYEDSKIITYFNQRADIDATKYSITIPNNPFDLIDILLLFLYKRTKNLLQAVTVNPCDYPLLYIKEFNEFNRLVSFARDMGYIYIDHQYNSPVFKLTLQLQGWKQLKSITAMSSKTMKVFVAMKFGNKELDEVYENGIDNSVRELGYIPYRVDKDEFNSKICDKIIAEINTSDFLIADVTIESINVYFEAGYAMGQRKPVIFCCKEGTMISGVFDTRQYNHVFWRDAEDLREKLHNRIQATVY